jgi:hypothetical protein
MSETVVPKAPDAPGVVPSQGVVSYLSGVTNYLRKLTSSIFGVAASVTQSAASYAANTRKSVDPIVGAVSDSAQALSDLTLLGALFSKPESKIRSIYDRSTSLAKSAKSFTEETPKRIEDYGNIAIDPTKLRENIRNVQLPTKRVSAETDSESAAKRKKKKKSNSQNRRGAKQSRRRY